MESRAMTIEAPDVTELVERGRGILDAAKSMTIATADDFGRADAFCVMIAEFVKGVGIKLDDTIKRAYEVHRGLTKLKAEQTVPAEEARKIVKGKMQEWVAEQDRIREAEQRRLEIEQRKRDEEMALAAAALAEKAGNKEAAEAIVAEAASAPSQPVILPTAVPKAKTPIRMAWDYVIDRPDLLPRDYLTPDTVKIGKVVRATAGQIKIPGVRCVQKPV